jgi:hypothetical protein
MWRIRMFVGLAAVAAGASLLPVASAGAANSATFRDCSLVAGTDPDFVILSGVTAGPGGSLTVKRRTPQVALEASESSDPGDNLGHVTLNVKVESRKVATKEVSGAGTGKVMVAVPLTKSMKVGRTYTISWAATFDNGNHACPSSSTPENTTPKPFLVTVTKK